MAHDAQGREIPDQTPLALPVDFVPPPTMVELIRMHVRREMSNLAQDHGAETFDEADDFDVEDDHPDPRTPYEAVFDPPPPPSEQASPAPAGAEAPPAGASVSSAAPSSPEASSPNPP